MPNLIIDTNLLLLLIIGGVEKGRHIKHSKRLGAFNIKDYDVIVEFMARYKVFITPYIATEVINLIDLTGEAKKLAFEIARILFSHFQKIEVCIDDDCLPKYFIDVGITDSSLIQLSPNYFILTNDNRLLPYLYTASPETILPYEVINNLCRE